MYPSHIAIRNAASIFVLIIIAAVIGGTLLTGGYGSVVGACFGALIFGVVQMGIFFLGIDSSWFRVFLGGMLLIAVIFNNFIRKKVTEAR